MLSKYQQLVIAHHRHETVKENMALLGLSLNDFTERNVHEYGEGKLGDIADRLLLLAFLAESVRTDEQEEPAKNGN